MCWQSAERGSGRWGRLLSWRPSDGSLAGIAGGAQVASVMLTETRHVAALAT